MIELILVLVTFIGAVIIGKLVSKLKLPEILGWLIAGMLLGPHALNVLNQGIMDMETYQDVVHIFECAVGLMIGTELVWKKNKSSGKSNYDYNFDAITRNFFSCIIGIFDLFLFHGNTVISCVYFWWNCFGDSSSTGFINCSRISY